METEKNSSNQCASHLEGAAMLLIYLAGKNVHGINEQNLVAHLADFVRSSSHFCETKFAERIEKLKKIYPQAEDKLRAHRGGPRHEVYRVIVFALRSYLGIK